MVEQISYARVKSDPLSAKTYSHRKQDKHDQEMGMLAKAFAKIPDINTVLDAPCGVGRASIWLAEQGRTVTGIDLGKAALTLAGELAAEAGVSVDFASHDIFDLPYTDQQYDATLCFRLLHHFESEVLRARLIAEMCRVSGRYVVMSRISPYSVTSLRRRLRFSLFGKPIKQYPVTAGQLHAEFAKHGFRPVSQFGGSEILHSLQLHVYMRG
ncbi:MAG: class I SAM-dependent methyltransferase [Gammaproteobacteria bacterium]